MIKALPRVLGMTITLYVWFGMSFEFQYRKSLCMYWLTSLKQVKKNRFIFMIPCVFMCKKENCLRKYFIITIEIFFFFFNRISVVRNSLIKNLTTLQSSLNLFPTWKWTWFNYFLLPALLQITFYCWLNKTMSISKKQTNPFSKLLYTNYILTF